MPEWSLARGTPEFKIERPWREMISPANNIYASAGFEAKRSALGILSTETPLSIVPRVMDLAVDFSTKEAKGVAERCSRKFRGIPWSQIACAASEVSWRVERKFKGKDRIGMNSFCRSQATVFRKVFGFLNIPRSNVTTVGVGENMEHVVNRVAFVDERGQPYAYMLDVGWFPDRLYPLTEDTIRFHRANPNELPAIVRDEARACPAAHADPTGLKRWLQDGYDRIRLFL